MSSSTIIKYFCIMAALLAGPLFAGIAPVNLRCGAWNNPLGIDEAAPRLSWQVVATNPGERGQSETAYQIQAAASMALLVGNHPDLWDTGKIISKQPFAIPYAGSPLKSGRQVFWRVKSWDKVGQPSAWSETATWTMGLMQPDDWQGKWLVAPSHDSNLDLKDCAWIWYPQGNPSLSAPVGNFYFRKAFAVRSDSPLTNATLLLTADNSYAAYVNGLQAGEGKDLTVAFPFTITRLKPGTNFLAIAAHNGGTADNPAGLTGKLVLNYADGTHISIQMDDSWKASNILEAGWESPGFNDQSWTNALVLGVYGMAPWGSNAAVPSTETAMPFFRREFKVKPGLQRAWIYICGLGQYELFANGAKAGDALLAPGWTKYDKTCLYDTLDLTSYLTNGSNALGMMLGNGMYDVAASHRYTKFTSSSGPPKFIAQLYLQYANGTREVISTDRQWLASSGPITFSSIYGGEDYDARLRQLGWNEAGFDAARWSSAVETNGPGGILRGQSYAAPSIKAFQSLPPVSTNFISSHNMVYDLGQNAAIIPSLKVHGHAGDVVHITPAELVNADGTINRDSVGDKAAYWQYTLGGNVSETWFPQFFYHGCRYLRVSLSAADSSTNLPVIDSLSGVVIHSSSANAGEFLCSNDLFNRIRTLVRWAQLNNLVSVLTDCPHRERLGWLEQYNLHGPSLRYEFDMGRLFSKTMQDMADSQTDSGLVPDIAPEYPVFSIGFRDSPEWGSSVIMVPWQHYLFTGDDSLLRNYYPAMTNYFFYLHKQAVNYFLKYPHGLGDWYDIGPKAPGYSQATPISLTADAYYYQDAKILAEASALIGHNNEAAEFNFIATNIATAFNFKFYSPAQGRYAAGSQTAQAMPLVLGLVESNNLPSVVAALVANVYSNGLTAGDIGHRYLLRALADAGRSDVVYDLHSGTNNPGYGYMLGKGATALTEAWDANPRSSQDHFMLGHIIEWFYHDLAGIQPDPAAPGFEHVIIKPACVGDIHWVNASHDSVRGKIISSWKLTNNVFKLDVTIPVGATASVFLPAFGVNSKQTPVWESGRLVYQAGKEIPGDANVKFDRQDERGSGLGTIWNISSGTYHFTSGSSSE